MLPLENILPLVDSNNTESLFFDDAVEVKINKLDNIKNATEELVRLSKHCEQRKPTWFSTPKVTEIEKDNLLRLLTELNGYTELQEAEKKEVQPFLLTAYKTLNYFTNSDLLDNSAKAQASTKQCELDFQCGGFASQLSALYSFLSTLDTLTEKSSPENFIFQLNSHQSLELIDLRQFDATKCIETKNYLNNILSFTKNETIMSYFTLNEVMKLKIVVFWMMNSYLNAHKEGVDVSEHIFALLRKINISLNDNLSQRSLKEFEGFSENKLITQLSLLKKYISENVYFKNFWNDASHLNELNEFEKYIDSCSFFLQDTSNKNVEGLVFIGRDDDAGLALYSLESEEEPKTLVAFSFNHDAGIHYYNFMQDRSSALGLNGLCSKPVADAAIKSKEALNKLLDQEQLKGKEFNYITVGFGIDGAIAQILSYSLAKKHPNSQTRSYGVAVPPYLETNAAATLNAQDNHYGLNFALKDDKWITTSSFNKSVAKAYSTDNFKALYMLYNRDWFLSDVTGRANKDIYLDKIKPGLEQPKQMNELFKEISDLTKASATSNTKELGANIAKLYSKQSKIEN